MTAQEYSKQYMRMQARVFRWMDKMAELETEYRKQQPFRPGTYVTVRFKNRRFIRGIIGSWEIDHTNGEFRPNLYKRMEDGHAGKHIYYPWDWEVTSIKEVEPK